MRVFRVRLTLRWVAAAGLILASVRSDTRAEPPIAAIASQAIEFPGLKDKAPITFRDMSAYAALLQRAREAKPADLAGLARRDVGFGELWDHPDDYRGALIELRGVCRRTYSSESKLGAGGRLHEVWITVPEDDPNPFACIAEALPEGFPIDEAGSEPVVFRGYFLKLIAYDASDVRRGAPLLIGRLERAVSEKPVDPLDEEEVRRLPVRASSALTVPRDEDRFTLRVDRDGSLALEDQPITRKDLPAKLARLAAQVHLNAQAVGMPLDANRELPAIIVIHADDETPCSTILRLGVDLRGGGFERFALKSQMIAVPAGRLAETRSAPAARNQEDDLPAELRTIPIRLVADDRGRIVLAEVGELQHQGFDSLRAELTSILDDPELAFDRARISVDPRLMCSELNRVIDVLARGHVTGFELAPSEPGDRCW